MEWSGWGMDGRVKLALNRFLDDNTKKILNEALKLLARGIKPNHVGRILSNKYFMRVEVEPSVETFLYITIGHKIVSTDFNGTIYNAWVWDGDRLVSIFGY